jgi:hypothetical protein
MAPRSAAHATLPRGRVRVTNKTRLKIVRGAIDADPIVLDEEEEKARASQLVAGVDLDDANVCSFFFGIFWNFQHLCTVCLPLPTPLDTLCPAELTRRALIGCYRSMDC